MKYISRISLFAIKYLHSSQFFVCQDERDTSKVFESTTRHFAANAGYIMQLEDDPDRQIRHNDHTIGVLTGHVNRLRRGGFERYAVSI